MIRAYTFYGIDIPPNLVPPPLDDIELAIWRDFSELSTERPAGLEKASIPWSAIVNYHAANAYMPFDDFHRIIRALDAVYMSHKPEDKK